MLICSINSAKGTFRMSIPLIIMLPDFTSQSRASKLAIVDFPLPEGPTKAVIESFFMAKLI